MKFKRRYIIAFIILILALGFGMALGAVTWIIQTTPDISNYQGSYETTHIYSADGDLLTRLFRENRVYVPLDRIPRHLKNAIIAIEDTNFYVHHGIDFWSIPRAFITNIKEGRFAQGFSTITMQLAENALFKKQQRSIYRKIQEIYLALQFERLYTKPEILEMYLNEIFLGHSAYGVETAAKQYFDRNIWELNLSECAFIAGLPKAPNYYSPFNNPEAALNRRNIVLSRMEELGYISREEAEQAKNEDFNLKASQLEQEQIAPYFIRYIRDELIKEFGSQMVYSGGLKVYTTLDLEMQKHAEESVKDALEKKYIPTVNRDKTADKKQPQMSLITINPKTGAIEAMVGGRGHDQFNRATQAVRQPGSAFKPFVYTTAINRGYSTSSVINDMPMSDPKGDENGNSIWPTNFQNKYRGFINLRTALTHSINVAAVKLLQKVGIEPTITTSKNMGISTFTKADYEPDHYSLALGGLNRGVKPIEMASAYGVLANQGILVQPFAIKKILDKRGNLLHEAHPRKNIVLDEEAAYIVTDMLASVIKDGTGWRADLNRPVAGKTGTTNNYTDAWFVGYTPDLVTAVWIGEDNLQKMIYDQKDGQGNYLFPEGNGPRIVSSSEAARLWGNYMKKVVKDMPVTNFSIPNKIVKKEIDPITGLIPNQYTPVTQTEIFREHNVPTRVEDLHQPQKTVAICTESNEIAVDDCPQAGIVEYNYFANSGIRVGPEKIQFQNTTKSGWVNSIYIVDGGEPVQKINHDTGLPIQDKNGRAIYHRIPNKKCSIHGSEDRVLENILNYFKNSDE